MVRLNTQQGNGEVIPFEVGRTLPFIWEVVPTILRFIERSVREFSVPLGKVQRASVTRHQGGLRFNFLTLVM